MGGFNLDPSGLMDILKQAGANTSSAPPNIPYQPNDVPQPSAPTSNDTFTQSLLNAPQPRNNNGAPPPIPQQQPQQQQRLQGVKGYLANILHGVGEGIKADIGLETDAQKQQRMFTQNLQTQQLQLNQQNIQSEIAQRLAQVKQMQSMVTMPGGYQVPFAIAKPYLEAQAKITAAQIGKRYVVQPNVGMWDTQADGGPKLIPGSDAQGVTVTPDIAQEYHMPQQLVGTRVPLGQFASYERAGAMWAPTVSGRQDVREVSDPDNPGATKLVTIPVTSTSQRQSPTGGAVTSPGTVGNAPGPGIVPTAPVQNKVSPPAPQSQGPRPPISLNTKGGVKTLVDASGNPLQGKSGADNVYATDPKSGQQIFTTRTEATAQGLQNPMKVSAPQVRKDQALSNRLADVQRKVGDYAATFDAPLSDNDKVGLAYLMDHSPAGNIHGVQLVPGYANSLLKQAGMQGISDAALKRYILYNQARESLSGYQQILTNSARSSDKVLELQLEQLPSPINEPDVARQITGQFQNNLDIAGQHMPMFPGSAETQQSIRAQQQLNARNVGAIQANQNKTPGQYAQGVSGAEPPRPSSVPQNYIFKANGPKGAGWYRP